MEQFACIHNTFRYEWYIIIITRLKHFDLRGFHLIDIIKRVKFLKKTNCILSKKHRQNMRFIVQHQFLAFSANILTITRGKVNCSMS